MKRRRDPGRNQRVDTAEDQKLGDSCSDLRRSHQSRRGDGFDGRRACQLQQPREVSRHRARDKPTAREHECEQEHLFVRPPADLTRVPRARLRRRQDRDREEVQRQRDQQVQAGPNKAGFAPAHCIAQQR